MSHGSQLHFKADDDHVKQNQCPYGTSLVELLVAVQVLVLVLIKQGISFEALMLHAPDSCQEISKIADLNSVSAYINLFFSYCGIFLKT